MSDEIRVGDEVVFVKDRAKGKHVVYRLIALDGPVAWVRNVSDGKYYNAWTAGLVAAGAASERPQP